MITAEKDADNKKDPCFLTGKNGELITTSFYRHVKMLFERGISN